MFCSPLPEISLEYVDLFLRIVLLFCNLRCAHRRYSRKSRLTYDMMELTMRCHLLCKSAKLFAVTNTSGTKQYVVSDCKECALWLSMTTGHIREIKNGRVSRVSAVWLAKDEPFISAMRRAVQAGFPGAIRRIENYAVIDPDRGAGVRGGVFMPLSGTI